MLPAPPFRFTRKVARLMLSVLIYASRLLQMSGHPTTLAAGFALGRYSRAQGTYTLLGHSSQITIFTIQGTHNVYSAQHRAGCYYTMH
ncbi:MAG: hypothetical protein ACI9UR_002008 [Bacteroidia bacterium]|jgi:hypothetical protein